MVSPAAIQYSNTPIFSYSNTPLFLTVLPC